VGEKSATLLSEVGMPHFVEKFIPFTPRVFVGSKTHASYIHSNHESPYASRDDCMPATDFSGNDSSLKDMLELISKRLENLESKRFFLSHDFEHSARRIADIEINTATLIVARAAVSADSASKSAIAAAVACKSAVAESMKISASQNEDASKYTAGRDDAQQAVVINTCCPVSPERFRSYYDGPTSSVRSSRQYAIFSVPTCVTTARIQNTKYPTTPLIGQNNYLLTMSTLM